MLSLRFWVVFSLSLLLIYFANGMSWDRLMVLLYKHIYIYIYKYCALPILLFNQKYGFDKKAMSEGGIFVKDCVVKTKNVSMNNQL